ncbi:MAG: DNA repair protein RecO [Clostridiales bacterium]|jgi:DNA repair protein RecO (recombination protein O)|nr:DNA repair protein RecO [Eubacteriales bacterium]MDH7565329.1 DNA repair protein RecO [Clostridiales bacterium]
MGYIRTKGIVIKEVNTGEADKVVTIFSAHSGKITGYAKGARRPKSRLAAGTQFLCYSDLVLFKGKELCNIYSSDVIDSFYELREDIVKLTYSAHMVDLISDVVMENQPASKVLQLFLNTLHVLAKTDRSPELVTRVFELRLLSLLGYAPYVRGCIQCGKSELEDTYFSFKKCGFLCEECLINDTYASKISKGTAKAMNFIIHAPLRLLFNFALSKEALEELGKIVKKYLRERLDKDYTKLDFLKCL